MPFSTASGTSVSISLTAPASYDATGYGALTKKVIGEVTEVPEHGVQWSVATHTSLASRGTQKAKGNYDNGSMTIPMALVKDDAGQIDCDTGVAQDEAVYICVTYPNGDEEWCEALVLSFKKTPGSGDSVMMRNLELDILPTPFVEIAA